MLNWLVKFLSVIHWMALVPRILRFTDFEDLIISALACNFCSPAAECRVDLQSQTGLFLLIAAVIFSFQSGKRLSLRNDYIQHIHWIGSVWSFSVLQRNAWPVGTIRSCYQVLHGQIRYFSFILARWDMVISSVESLQYWYTESTDLKDNFNEK